VTPPSPSSAEPTRPLVGDPPGPTPHGHGDESPQAAPPLLRVVKGEPTAQELVALTVVVATLSQRRARPRPAPVGAWAAFGDAHRTPLRPGPGGWRAAGRFA
jgi:hypothetical protein